MNKNNSYSLLLVNTGNLRNESLRFNNAVSEGVSSFREYRRKVSLLNESGRYDGTTHKMEDELENVIRKAENILENSQILGNKIVPVYILAEENIICGTDEGSYMPETETDTDTNPEKEDTTPKDSTDSKDSADQKDSTDSDIAKKSTDNNNKSKSDSSGWKEKKRFGGVAYDKADFVTRHLDNKGKIIISSQSKNNGKDKTTLVASAKRYFGSFTIGKRKNSKNDCISTVTKDKTTGTKVTTTKLGTLKEYSKGDKFGSVKNTYISAAAGIGGSAALVKLSDSVDKKLFRGGGELHVGEVSGELSGGIGVFDYKDANGKIHKFTGLRGNAEASVSVFGASAYADVGTSYIGGGAKASVDVLEAEANAKLHCGYVAGKGLSVVGAAGFEANVFKATGNVYGRALGVEVGAAASVKVGLSLGGKIGYEDGKFKIGGSFALGVGVDFDITIDFSKVGSAIKELYEDVKSGLEAGAKACAKKIVECYRWFRSLF